MVAEVLKRALAGDDGLDEESSHGEHSETAVLDFLDLELSKSIGVVSQTQGVEGTTGVESIETLSPVASANTSTSAESLSLSHEDNEDSDSGNDRLSVDQVGVAEVVEAILREDSGLDLEPFGIGAEVHGARALELLGDEAAESAKHSPACVDDLDLTIASESLGVSRETSGIPAVVTGVLTCIKTNIKQN